MGDLHDLLPDAGGQAATHDLIHGAPVVIADPNAASKVGGISDEPGVAEILRGACFAASHMARQSRPASRPPGHARAQHIIHSGDVRGRHNLNFALRLARIEHPSRAHAHTADTVGLNRAPAVGKHAIGTRQFHEADFGCAERERRILAQLRGDAKTPRRSGHFSYATLRDQAGCHRIDGLGQGMTQSNGAGILAVVVARRPAADGERRIIDQAVRRVPGFDR